MIAQAIFTHTTAACAVPSDAPHFVHGTRLMTPTGACPVEDLVAGDAVLTRSGVLRVARVWRVTTTRVQAISNRSCWPMRVPVGSLGNPRPLRLSSAQEVVLDGPCVEARCGVPVVSVPVSVLLGLRGIMLERPVSDLRWCGMSLGLPAMLRLEGALCATEASSVLPDTDAVRAAFIDMGERGEPALQAP